jgi:hypothetical protein
MGDPHRALQEQECIVDGDGVDQIREKPMASSSRLPVRGCAKDLKASRAWQRSGMHLHRGEA